MIFTLAMILKELGNFIPYAIKENSKTEKFRGYSVILRDRKNFIQTAFISVLQQNRTPGEGRRKQ